MKFIFKVLSAISLCLFMLGMGAMDSECLAIPVVMCLGGLLGIILFGRYAYEED